MKEYLNKKLNEKLQKEAERRCGGLPNRPPVGGWMKQDNSNKDWFAKVVWQENLQWLKGLK